MSHRHILRQVLVASSPQLGALAVGGAIGFPKVLLQQLRDKDSTIPLDFETSSWIGSIHGLAGLPSVLMPTLMQWKGRKPAFLICCLLIIIGWCLVFLAKTTTTILISEFFLGFGGNSLLIVSFSSITEMTDPKFRNSFIILYGTMQALGISSAGILGQYLHWKTVSLVYLIPIVLTFVNAFIIWPESPAWLALKQRYKDCEETFHWLRGNDVEAEKELLDLQHPHEDGNKFQLKMWVERDFYIPIALMFVLLNLSYWSGQTVAIIYSRDIIKTTTSNDVTAANGMMILDVLLFISEGTCAILARKLDNKFLVLITSFGAVLSLIFCCIVTYLQSTGFLGPSSLCFYGLISFVICCNIGLTPIVFVIALEIVPVKHRGVGGMFYIVILCCLHTSSLKAAPYMFLTIDLWGSFLVYAINGIVCMTIIWVYVPETKCRTLQELEDYFINGKFIKRVNIDSVRPIMNKEYSEDESKNIEIHKFVDGI